MQQLKVYMRKRIPRQCKKLVAMRQAMDNDPYLDTLDEEDVLAKLNPRQKRFAVEYVKNGGNGIDAVIKAGYKLKRRENCSATAHRLVRTPEIKKYIQMMFRKIDKEIEATLEWKIKKLKLCVERAAPDYFKQDYDDTRIGDINFANSPAAISAIAELNKMQGHYAPTKSLNTNLNQETDLEKERLDSLIKQCEREF